MVATPRGVQASWKFAAIAEALRPIRIPIAASASSVRLFAQVNAFCTSLPNHRPRVLSTVRPRMSAIAVACCTERLTA